MSVPVFSLGAFVESSLILKDPVPFEYWFFSLLPRSSFALFTCGFTSLVNIDSGGGVGAAGGKGGGGAGGKGGAGGGEGALNIHIRFLHLLWILCNQLRSLVQLYT